MLSHPSWRFGRTHYFLVGSNSGAPTVVNLLTKVGLGSPRIDSGVGASSERDWCPGLLEGTPRSTRPISSDLLSCITATVCPETA